MKKSFRFLKKKIIDPRCLEFKIIDTMSIEATKKWLDSDGKRD